MPPSFPAHRVPVYLQHVQQPLHEQLLPSDTPILVILPAFTSVQPASWFIRCEDAFWMRGIVDQYDMIALAFKKLDEAAHLQVDDLTEMTPHPRGIRVAETPGDFLIFFE